jgi:recombinational DNA repair protein (RecF pathway)
MTYEQIVEYAEEHADNPEAVLTEILWDLIDEKGWSPDTTLQQAVQTHSQLIERKLKVYA